ncbi:MAG: amidohydrolase family protein [Desulfobacterales bacterium]|nr:amidohydrolase family protein [Desulfobacterales bacterium]
MIIDSYSHGYYGKYLDQLVEAGGDFLKQTLDRIRHILQKKPSLVDISLRMKLLDKYGIDRQLLTTIHTMDCNLFPGDQAGQLVIAKAVNEHMARITEDSKGRLLAAGNVPLADFEKGGRQEMDRAIQTLGLKAVMINSNFNGKPIDLPEFEPFWAHAAQMNVPVYIHPNHPAGTTDRSYEDQYGLIHNFGWPYETVLALARLVFSGIMERYPTLKVVSHHLGGGMIPFFMGRTNESYSPEEQQKCFGRVLPRPLEEYFSRFYYDTAVGGSAPAVRCAYEVFGADRIIFATDFPLGPGTGEDRLAQYPEVIRSLGLSEAETRAIFSGNARRVIHLDS